MQPRHRRRQQSQLQSQSQQQQQLQPPPPPQPQPQPQRKRRSKSLLVSKRSGGISRPARIAGDSIAKRRRRHQQRQHWESVTKNDGGILFQQGENSNGPTIAEKAADKGKGKLLLDIDDDEAVITSIKQQQQQQQQHQQWHQQQQQQQQQLQKQQHQVADSKNKQQLSHQKPDEDNEDETLEDAAEGDDERGESCRICLSDEVDQGERGKLDCCDHFFCYGCIVEWSKVETRCPVCKQRFVTIVRSTHPGQPASRGRTLHVPVRDQVYEPSEEEIRGVTDPYANIVCIECHETGDEGLLLLCDFCDSAAHTYCVGLGYSVPRGDWFCNCCRDSLVSNRSAAEPATPAAAPDGTLEYDDDDDPMCVSNCDRSS